MIYFKNINNIFQIVLKPLYIYSTLNDYFEQLKLIINVNKILCV